MQPDFGKVSPSKHAPIVVVGEAVDADFMRSLSRYYLLQDVHVEQGPVGARFAETPLLDRNGLAIENDVAAADALFVDERPDVENSLPAHYLPADDPVE